MGEDPRTSHSKESCVSYNQIYRLLRAVFTIAQRVHNNQSITSSEMDQWAKEIWFMGKDGV